MLFFSVGNDMAEWVETLPCSFKVHSSVCAKLKKLVARIMKIFSEIEAARPRCSSGIEALCSLNNALEKAKLLLQYCSESSKLYLAITGDAIVSRCRRAKNLLEQSLGQIQSMVPVMLAVKISHIIDDLRMTVFVLDSPEEEAGKYVRELIQQNASASVSVQDCEIKALHSAALKLHITNPKAILIEKRSLKRLLDKIGDSDPNKMKILKYLLYLLRKHENVITGVRKEKPHPQHEDSFSDRNCSYSFVSAQAAEVESCGGHEQHNAEIDVLGRAIPPEEFRCSLSLGLMYDPVVIASGQTFERMWIQKWLDEDNDTCPKTKMKLDNLLVTPNTVMKDLISKWCSKYEVTIDDPSRQHEACHNLDFSSTSVASFGSSIYDLRLPSDVSSVSTGASDTSYCFEGSHAKISRGSSFMPLQTIDVSDACHSDTNHNEADTELLSRLGELPWESQIKTVEDLRSCLEYNGQAFRSMSAENFVEPMVKFLKDAHELHDAEAVRAGFELLLDFLTKSRRSVESLSEDAFTLLSQSLDSDVTEEALNIMEVLSAHPYGQSKITSSGALSSILNILDSQIMGLQEQAIITLKNMSASNEICLELVSLQCIQKLVRFLQQNILAKHCLIILRNLCNIEKGRASLAETSGCLASISELIEFGSAEEQENAVGILLSLCAQKTQYCQLVMDEGANVITSLVDISINGNKKAKASAFELLRVLREANFGEEQEQEPFASGLDDSEDITSVSKGTTPSSKTSRFLGLKLPITSSLSAWKKR